MISSNECEVTGNCSTTTGDVVREGTLPTVGDQVDVTSLGVSLMVDSFDAAEDREPCRSLLIRALKPAFVTLEDFVPNTDGTSWTELLFSEEVLVVFASERSVLLLDISGNVSRGVLRSEERCDERLAFERAELFVTDSEVSWIDSEDEEVSKTSPLACCSTVKAVLQAGETEFVTVITVGRRTLVTIDSTMSAASSVAWAGFVTRIVEGMGF